MFINQPDRIYRHAALALMGVLLALVFLTFRHYGVSWDEELQSQYGQAIFDYYASGFADNRYDEIFNLHLYGGMFDGLAAWVNATLPSFETVYQTRHLLNALIGLLGLWGTWRLGRLMGGGFVGLVAMALLALMPSYYGHMFNNPKDIPFAAGVVWSLYYMAKTLLAYPGIRLSVILKLGIIMGLTLGVRVNGVMILGFWGLTLAAQATMRIKPRGVLPLTKAAWAVAKIWLAGFAVSYIFMLICWPWAQESPIDNPLKAIIEFSNFPQIVEVLFDGKTYMSTQLPWTYVPHYFFVQMPILQIVLLCAAFVGLPLLWHRLERNTGKRGALVLMFLSAGFPIVYAMACHPALYDAVRHFTFALPVFAILGALALRESVEAFMRATKRIGALGPRLGLRYGAAILVAVLAYLPFEAMLRLHPYEYIYTNEIVGGVRQTFGKYAQDYWGTSFKEAAERLQTFVATEGGVPNGKIYKIAICGPWAAATIYLPPDYEAVVANAPADFFMATTRWMCQNMRPGKEIIRVERYGVPLSVIKDLRGTEDGELGMPNYREEQRKLKEKEE